MAQESQDNWWDAPEGEKHVKLFQYVSAVERVQSFLFERFERLSCLYDPYHAYLSGMHSDPRGPDAVVSENVIATNVDTVTAVVAATDVRARFMTDDGDWSTQRTARYLEWYAEGLAKLLEVHPAARDGFKEAALKGTGLCKVYVDWGTKEIRVEPVLVQDVVVDEAECRSGGMPRQLTHRVFVDRDVLKAKFPKYADEIEKAQRTSTWRDWANYRPIKHNEVVALETWRLPIGKKGSGYYIPGRHVLCVDRCDIVDEEYEKPFFPIARIIWSKRQGWYGIGGAERVAGHQRTLNKRNFQIDRQLDQLAFPVTYIRPQDAAVSVKTTNKAGMFVPIKGDFPKTVIAPAVSTETYQDRANTKESAYEEFGVSRMAANSRKPAGIESGAALREYRDQTTQRFAMQEKAFEQFVLDILWLCLDCAKDLGKDAPVITRKSKYGVRKIPWSKVDLAEVKVQMQAASTLSRTPAGRTQMVLEWAQAGVISQDEARRLIRHPDLERAMSLYTAAIEDIELAIEEILDGNTDVVPEPFQNLKLGIWRMQQAVLKGNGDQVPEEILDVMRQWVTQAVFLLQMANPPAPAPGMGAPQGGPVPPQDMPSQGPAVSAFAPESIGVAPA